MRLALPLVGSETRHERDARRLVIVEDDEEFARTLAPLVRAARLCGAHRDRPGRTRRAAAHRSSSISRWSISSSARIRACPASPRSPRPIPATRIVVLTGFASIATAVEAIKLGAAHYLPKPSNTDDIEAAFGRAAGDAAVPSMAARPRSGRSEWEKINETLIATGFNISETARRLGMHRRTLARKLEKRPVR